MRLFFPALSLILVLSLFASPRAQVPAFPPSADTTSIQPPTDSAAMASEPVRHVVKRDFNARQQVVAGTAIMTFLVVIITTVSNWNP